MKSIVVIMPSFLSEYPGAATNRQEKFCRAVDSFLNQTYDKKHLIIVSDGCLETSKTYVIKYKPYDNISLVKIPKQARFSGNVRQAGIEFNLSTIKAPIVTYLDTDDEILAYHLDTISNQFFGNDWVYFDDKINNNGIILQTRITSLQKNFVGTSNIAHISSPKFNWDGCDGYGHDWIFITSKLMNSLNFNKINCDSYVVHHSPGNWDN